MTRCNGASQHFLQEDGRECPDSSGLKRKQAQTTAGSVRRGVKRESEICSSSLELHE